MENTVIANKTKWVLDTTHSEITFKIRHLMISNVKGAFKNFSLEVEGDEITQAPIQLVIDASSIDTGNEDRDNHLRSNDFFSIERFPSIEFTSKSFQAESDSQYQLLGELNMHGVKREIVLNVEYGGRTIDPYGNVKVGYTVEGVLNRKDWGLGWNTVLEAGGVAVGEEVKISAEIQLVKQ